MHPLASAEPARPPIKPRWWLTPLALGVVALSLLGGWVAPFNDEALPAGYETATQLGEGTYLWLEGLTGDARRAACDGLGAEVIPCRR